MSWKRRIQNNLDSDETLAWVLANSAKFGTEITLASVTIVPFFAFVFGAVRLSEGEFPFGAAGPTTLYVILVAGAYKEFWNCRLGSDD